MSDPQNPDKLVAVFDNIDPTLISIARDFLKDAGIESFVSQASNLFGNSVLTPTRLMVWADEADDARERLKELGMANADPGSHGPAKSAPLRWFGVPKSRFRDEARRRMARRRMWANPPPWVRVVEVSFCGGVLGFGLFYIVVRSVSNLADPPMGAIWEGLGFAIGATAAGCWTYRHRHEKLTKTEKLVIFFAFAVMLLKRLGFELTYSP